MNEWCSLEDSRRNRTNPEGKRNSKGAVLKTIVI